MREATNSGTGRNIDATLTLTGSGSTATATRSLMLSVPGYLLLSEGRDYAVARDEVIGRGGSAVICRGYLVPEREREHGFASVAVKLYKGKMSEASIKFELALLSYGH